MIKSMTGYGNTIVDVPGKKFTIEIRALNSKGLDLNVKIPSWFREKEPEIRRLLSGLQRGKTDLFISAEYTGESLPYSINMPLAKKYHAELKALEDGVGETASESLLPIIVKMPDVLQTSHEGIDHTVWEKVNSGLSQALDKLDVFRLKEGKVLEEEISARVAMILELLDKIHPFEAERKERVKSNLRRDLEQLSTSSGTAGIDPNRFEQELIFYLEKMDFTEEKVRLKRHCDYFSETLQGKESQGKKLGFICQEMGREINTLGSKAYHADIQKLVVQMKDELEKIKEQLLNIL